MSTTDPYNRSGYYVFLTSMVATTVFFIYIAFIHPGVKGVDKNIVEDYSPEKSAQAFDLASVAEPWVSSPEMVAAGKKSFQLNCASCHGADAKGMAAMGSRDLVEGQWKIGGTSIALFKTLETGLESDPSIPSIMASFKHLPVNERWALVNFIRSITENKVANDEAKLKEFGQQSLQN